MANEIEKARIKLNKAQDGLFYSYSAKIRRAYDSGNQKVKFNILNGLERVVQYLNDEPQKSPFDPSIAKMLRLEAGLNKKELGEITGVDSTYIVVWENGRRIPSPLSRLDNNTPNEGTRGYLLWLKQKGYNPFNLKGGKNEE